MIKNQWVLITGASTGIGRVATEFLSQKGFSIYACARNESDLQDLGKISNVIPIKLDVTKDDQIKQAFQEVSDRKTGLFGLVNNAGIVHAGPTMDLDVKELQHQFDVNFFGIHRVTKQFFPLIKESKGKVIMMGSGAGIIANPFFAPYSSSKFALEGYTDSLRRELMLFGIQVVIIEPGMVKTPIWDKGEVLLKKYDGNMLKTEASGIGSMAVQTARDIGLPPEKIASLIHKILTKKNPKPRYAIVPNYWMRQFMLKMPTRMLDRFILKKMQKFH